MPNKAHVSPLKILAILAAAGIASAWIYFTGPTTRPEEEVRPPKIVKTSPLQPTNQTIHVSAYGSVIPAQQVTVEPQVSGHIIQLNPKLIPGGTLQKGDPLFSIDPALAQINLREAQAELARGQAEFQEAQRKSREGQRLAAEKVIPSTESAALEAELLTRTAELERLKARLDRNRELLARHTLPTPFNALVLNESVEIGQRVDPGDATVTLVGTDAFWVQVAIPTDKLQHIQLPSATHTGATATITLDNGTPSPNRYQGQVIQLLGNMEESGRMARILVEIQNPLQPDNESTAPLLLGSYVRVDIHAGQLSNVFVINRTALREGNRIWIADANQTLQIRQATVLWHSEDTVSITAPVQPGEQLITSDLRVALPDMKINAQSIQPGS
ncbi:MAG: hypothetical protein RI897_3371 [Verrucomicrobiota bacterium]|jgi:RND family efflux transporter MFP subunit